MKTGFHEYALNMLEQHIITDLAFKNKISQELCYIRKCVGQVEDQAIERSSMKKVEDFLY